MMKDKYKILIISCWAVLIVYCLIKVLGGNYFDIEVNWSGFINICNFFDAYPLLSCFIKAPFYSVSSYLIYLAMTNQKIKDDWWVLLVFLASPFLKRYITVLGFILDTIMIIILPFIKLLISKNSIWKSLLIVIIANVLTIVFQFISILTRNVGYFIPLANNTLIGIILSIDYYIMIILYYLYTREISKKKGGK